MKIIYSELQNDYRGVAEMLKIFSSLVYHLFPDLSQDEYMAKMNEVEKQLNEASKDGIVSIKEAVRIGKDALNEFTRRDTDLDG